LGQRLRSGLKGGLYAFLASLLLILTKVLFFLRIEGRENLKRDGEYIIVARHRSYWDIPILIAAIGPLNRIHFIARKGLMRRNPIVRPLIRMYATVIDRDGFGKQDFRRMLTAIKRERLVGIFPEGTTKRRTEAKGGAIRFAALTKKDLLPVNIRVSGPYPPEYPFRFPRVTVSIGEPFSLRSLEREVISGGSRADRQRMLNERLMRRVDSA